MIRATSVAVLVAMLMGPALAEDDKDILLTINNQSSQVVDRINIFPVDEDGEAIEDNLGGLTGEDLPAGASAKVTLSTSRCGLVRAYVGLEGGRELEGDIDTCSDQVLNITD